MSIEIKDLTLYLNRKVIDQLTLEDGWYKSAFHKYYFRHLGSLKLHWQAYLEERRGELCKN